MLSRIKNIIQSKMDARTKNVSGNMVLSLIYKVINISCSLILVPLTLGYLTGERYGLWMELSSILVWIAFFDVGLGNGLRNYLTNALSSGNYVEAKSFVSTALIILLAITAVFFVIMAIAVPLFDWNNVLNSHTIEAKRLTLIVVVAMSFTLVNFVVKNVGVLFMAMQRYSMNDLLQVVGHALSLVAVYIITKITSPGNLLYVVLAYSAVPVIVFTLAAIPVFYKYDYLRPSIKSFDKNKINVLVGKSLGFFIIQITSCLVVFGSSQLIIGQLCGTTDVAVYNTSYKYFNVMAMVYTIFLAPLWNAYTDAAVKNDWVWIKKSYRRALGVWCLFAIGGLLMLLFSPYIFKFWLHDKITIPFAVSASILFFILTFCLNNCATYLLNGLNTIRIQIITSVCSTVLFLSTVFYAGRHWGVIGITMCMSICYLAMCLVHIYQNWLIIHGRAKGIWAK